MRFCRVQGLSNSPRWGCPLCSSWSFGRSEHQLRLLSVLSLQILWTPCRSAFCLFSLVCLVFGKAFTLVCCHAQISLWSCLVWLSRCPLRETRNFGIASSWSLRVLEAQSWKHLVVQRMAEDIRLSQTKLSEESRKLGFPWLLGSAWPLGTQSAYVLEWVRCRDLVIASHVKHTVI